MVRKPIWATPVEAAAWQEKNCRVCFQPDEAWKRVAHQGPGCPHLLRAAQDRLPSAWTARRNAPMGETYRCADFLKKPPVERRKTAPDETLPLFDPAPEPLRLVPVDGWPDRPTAVDATHDHQ